MVARVLVLHSLEYNIPATADKAATAGVKLDYLELGSPINEPKVKGHKPVAQSLPLSEVPNLTQVPGIYEMSFTMGTTKNGRGDTVPVLKPTGVKFLSGVSLQPLPTSAAPTGPVVAGR